jgi:hypothetical protein
MVRIENSVFCDGCGVEILLAPVVQEGSLFCCKDCADGLECECSAIVEADEEI